MKTDLLGLPPDYRNEKSAGTYSLLRLMEDGVLGDYLGCSS